MRITTTLLASALHLACAAPLAAQVSMALSAGPSNREPELLVSRALLGAALKPAYAVRLVSDWPQLSAGGGGCVNGGQEMLTGTLSLTSGGNYADLLERQATILFCGVHGVAQSACALTLTSRGVVEARGEVRPVSPGWSEPLVELRWAAPEGASEIAIEGDCTPAFNESLRRLYLGVTHALEFPLPIAGEGRLTQRLDEYCWIVDIR